MPQDLTNGSEHAVQATLRDLAPSVTVTPVTPATGPTPAMQIAGASDMLAWLDAKIAKAKPEAVAG